MALRIDTRQLRKTLEDKRRKVKASAFRGELETFAAKVLTTAMKITPVRSVSAIRTAQSKQYDHRINYIPSYHTLENPTLIVNEEGEHWLYLDDKWYAVSYRDLPPEAEAVLGDLENERSRRMGKPRAQFIEERAQARFLYRRVWFEVAKSIGVTVPVSANVQAAHSRHDPKKAPPKGYGQWRGGKTVLSISVYVPSLETPSRYKNFTGREILAKAISIHKAEFTRDVSKKLASLIKV